MANVKYERRFRTALSIDETFLRRIVEATQDFVGKQDHEIMIETQNNLTITGPSLDEVLRNEIIETELIKKIRIEARQYLGNDAKRFSFDVEKNEELRTCWVTVDGPDANHVMAIRSRLESLIRSASLWYSFVRPNNYGAALFLSGFISAAVFALLIAALKILSAIESWLIAITIFLIGLMLAIVLINSGARRLFPAVVFEIGYSKRAATRIATARNTLFVFIGLGIVVSIVASFLFERLRW